MFGQRTTGTTSTVLPRPIHFARLQHGAEVRVSRLSTEWLPRCPWVPREAIERHFPRHHWKYRARQDSGGSRCRRSCHSKNRDHAGRCSASAPTGFASVRLVIFSDATRATAGSTRGITYGLRITRGRCRTRCKIKRNSATGSTASVCGACELGRRECPRLITPTHDDAALMILSRLITCRTGRGAPRDQPSRRGRACRASFQANEMNRPEQPFISVEKVSSNTAL